MILPIKKYGNSVLRKKSINTSKDYPKLEELINDMFDTLENSKGIGLSAHQVGLNLNLFIVDTTFLDIDEKFKKVFINSKITNESGEEVLIEEGCLSFPDIFESVYRKPNIKISYYDENFDSHDEDFDGIIARIIQHEYDHINGILLIDRISPIKKHILRKKLKKIQKHYKTN